MGADGEYRGRGREDLDEGGTRPKEIGRMDCDGIRNAQLEVNRMGELGGFASEVDMNTIDCSLDLGHQPRKSGCILWTLVIA